MITLLSTIALGFVHELYAVAALIGAAAVVIGRLLHLPSGAAAGAGAVLCFGLRFMALRRGWQLPIARPLNNRKGT